jgi:hypothetical protein
MLWGLQAGCSQARGFCEAQNAHVSRVSSAESCIESPGCVLVGLPTGAKPSHVKQRDLRESLGLHALHAKRRHVASQAYFRLCQQRMPLANVPCIRQSNHKWEKLNVLVPLSDRDEYGPKFSALEGFWAIGGISANQHIPMCNDERAKSRPITTW